MEKNSYSGAELHHLIKKSGFGMNELADALNSNYMTLYRLLQKKEISLRKAQPILLAIGALKESENFDYKSEYFKLKSKYETLIEAIKPHVLEPSFGTVSGQI